MKRFIEQLPYAFYVAFRFGLQVLARVAVIFASSAQTSPADEELASSMRGGVLNYRTGMLDDGTDPYGWYEED
tara:strand:- start:30 stop:248 length:219 start_codon:yes stop_codon:yes gene_type:complete